MGAVVEIDLRCGDVLDMLRSLPTGCAPLVMADPPWAYDNSGVRGAASNHYDGLSVWDIAQHMISAARVASEHAYMGVWCTFPKLQEWLWESYPLLASAGWLYVTGGAWGKTNGMGPGHHFRGDAEVLLLYKKGAPKPLLNTSNLWLAPRIGHSEKPQHALRSLVATFCPPGGVVVDLYAGASASLALACRALGRGYVGAELSPERHRLAMVRLSQQEMELSA